MSIIDLEDVVFSYNQEEGEVKALDGVSLSIEKGEYVAILGHNGSGKSTLAKQLNALLLPKGGRVYLAGMDTLDEALLWEIRRTCQMVFQNPDNQLVSTIIEDEVAFGPENLGLEREEIRRRVDKALEAVDMTAYKDKAPSNLSGGQKQRIAIAGVLAMEPEIIVFDEPTAMLDPEGRKDVLNVMKKLNDQGITIVNITHHMDEAVRASRIVVIDSGKIIKDGPTREVFSDVDLLKGVGLDVPQVTELAHKLRLKGFDIEEGILNPEELVEAL